MNANDDRSMGLIAWQQALYPAGHQDRRNLILHAFMVPVFMAGTVAVLAGAVISWRLAVAGAIAMALSMAAQGRGHKQERTPPVPFRGPADVAARLLLEQWVTFPRFVISGGFSRALRAARRPAA
ncbi:Phage terminase, small subunit protein [Minicystis rosea]|nr:Phage terminase, small subunit protein [Minicystis rosea]